MRWLRPSSEAEMVALFLRTELPAARFRDTLRALLESTYTWSSSGRSGGSARRDRDGVAGVVEGHR